MIGEDGRRHSQVERLLQICFVCPGAYPLFDPSVGEPTGGMESRAWIFARQLARRDDMQVTFVVRDHGQGTVRRFDNINVYAWQETMRTRLMRLALNVPGAGGAAPQAEGTVGRRFASHMWRLSRRVARAGVRLARQTFSGVAAGPALFARLPATVFLTFGVNPISADVIASCRQAGRKSIVCLASDVDLEEVFMTPSANWRDDGIPGNAGHFVLTQADEIVVQSRRQLALLRERFGRTGHLIHNPIDLEGDDSAGRPLEPDVAAIVAKGPYILWVGRSDPVYKRPELCLDLAHKLPQVRFVMVVSPSDAAYHAELKRRRRANVDLIEGLPFRAMPHLFRGSLALVNTSTREGFPNTFLQAGKYHVPVVSLNVDPEDMFSVHGAGLVCQGNLDRMADSVGELVINPEQRRKSAERLSEYVARHHALQGRCDELSEVIYRTVRVHDDSMAPARALPVETESPVVEKTPAVDTLSFSRLAKAARPEIQGMRPLRIAFLTPEFPTELAGEGGLSNYLNRISRALVEAGHVVEVFTLSAHPETAFDFEGVLVRRVNHARDPAWLSGYARWVRGPASIAGTRLHVRGARALAQALARRDEVAPFDIVQSSNYALAGLFVPRLAHRTHLVRCSSSNALWRSADRRYPNLDGWYSDRLECRFLSQADVIYAPSRFVAEDYRVRFGIPVQVVRPPIFVDTQPGSPPPLALPSRYLMHFGQISRLKGSDVLAEALNRAWAVAPDLRMVWAGADHRRQFARYRRMWGDRGDRVTWCGPLGKPQLYALVRQSVATVAPSRFDNLPNTVLESLKLGTPVIGSSGASIDEIVESGIQGELVPVGDAEALSRMLVRAWHGAPPFDGRKFPRPQIFDEMSQAVAVRKFLELTGRGEAPFYREVA